MPKKTTTVDGYLKSLPEDRRAALSAVRSVILKNLDSQYEEGILYKMIGYYVPHSVYPKGYHCSPEQPLPFAALGSSKSYMSLHLMSLYFGGSVDSAANQQLQWFREAWSKTGKKLDMGKACIHFKKIEDLALDVIGEAVKRVPAAAYIKLCETSLEKSSKQRAARKAADPRKKPSQPKRRR